MMRLRGVVALDFEEFAVVDDRADDFIHVVGTCGGVGDDLVERIFEAVDRVGARNQRGFFEVVLWNEAEELADNPESVFAVFCREVAYAAFRECTSAPPRAS